MRNISFSAHADSKGILQLISQVEPENIILIHGEKEGMKAFQNKIRNTLNIPCFCPENNTATEVKIRIPSPLYLSKTIYDTMLFNYNLNLKLFSELLDENFSYYFNQFPKGNIIFLLFLI